MPRIEADVVIVGGGPGGSTCGAFLKKHDPRLNVLILERETFPRDHVGESLLPMTCTILDELGVWDKIERQGFPVKIGATLRWGNSHDLWDFNFLPNGDFARQERPAPYAGQRRRTAFQVDRSIYDDILIKHAQALGCQVRFSAPVREVISDGQDAIEKLILGDGTEVVANTFVDASGHAGIIRRKMGVKIEEPSLLRNIAVWDYWRNADWAVQLGIEGTRIQILSLGYGWLWYIQIGDDRTSVGLVCPAEYYKSCGLSMDELYEKAISDEPLVTSLLSGATCEGILSTTKDWSFVSERMTGANWYLVGEAQGFADPILSAGITLTQASAKEAAFTILEERRGGNREWLRSQFEEKSARRIKQHIRFADFWYVGNGNMTDLQDYVSEIAAEVGLELNGEMAFRWLASGGFVEEDMEVAGIAAIRLDQVHAIGSRLSDSPPESMVSGRFYYFLDTKEASPIKLARYENGRVATVQGLKRGDKTLPLNKYFGWVIEGLKHSPQLDLMLAHVEDQVLRRGFDFDDQFKDRLLEALEAMVRDGWVKRRPSDSAPDLRFDFPHETPAVKTNVPGH